MSIIKHILTDIVTHTHNLGNLPLVKVTGDDESTVIESVSEDRSVVLHAKTADAIPEFKGLFGMSNLDKLSLHLKNPEYKENAKINVVTAVRNNVTMPVTLHFENESGDFVNDYRFMNSEIIAEKLKTVKFRGAKWDVEFTPQVSAINRFKLQASAHAEEKLFRVSTDNGNLVFSFGDASAHAGNFVFNAGTTQRLKQTLAWPVAQVLSILALDGEKTMRISDQGAMQINVDSEFASYSYVLPANVK